MRGEHKAIRNEVNRIKTANKELKATEHRLRAANKKNLDSKVVQTFIEQLYIDDFEDVTDWHYELLRQQRNMLHLIFDTYEMDHDGKEAMTKSGFEQFATRLPEQYQKK
eukprot:40373_1